MFQKFITLIRTQKKKSIFFGIIFIGIVIVLIRVFSNNTGETRYVLATAQIGDLSTSVTGSGQVSASNEVELTAKASGDITNVAVKAGQQVLKGALIASIDASDAALALENAQLSYDELISVDPDDVRKAQNTRDDAKKDVTESYQSARTTLSTQSTSMADSLADIDALLSGYINPAIQGRSSVARSYIDTTEKEYYAADKLLKDFQKKYRSAGTLTDISVVEALLSQASGVADALTTVAKSAKDTVTYLRDREDSTSSEADSAYTSANTISTDAHTSVSALETAANTIDTAAHTLQDATEALSDVENGPDELDRRSEALSVKQKQEAYNDYFIRAPFDGVVASVSAQKGDSANSGTAIATLITHDKIAEITLNEVDAAKVVAGNKVTLTFDALEDLTISGTVAEVDQIGTVSQGVVNYGVKISFDTDDDRVKSGMSVSASIVIESKTGVLTVPTSAVKTGKQGSYVLVLDGVSGRTSTQGVTSETAPREVSVTVGSTNDTMTEIISGISEGDHVVSRIITASTTAATTSAPSLFGNTAARGGTTTRTQTTSR